MPLTDVQAVIVSRNPGLHLMRVVNILLSVLPTDNILIVDNNSQDECIKMLPKQVRVKSLSCNIGFVAAANIGLFDSYQMGRKFLLLVNQDVWFEPDALIRLRNIMEKDSQIGAAFASVIKADNPNISDGAIGKICKRSVLLTFTDEGRNPPQSGAPIAADFGNGCFAMWSVQAVCGAGGFDPRLFAYHDEADMSIKLKSRGYKILVVPSIRIMHKGHMPDSPGFLIKQYFIARNTMLLSGTHFSGITAGRILFFALIRLMMNYLYLNRNLSPKAIKMRIAGWSDGLMHRKIRNEIQNMLQGVGEDI